MGNKHIVPYALYIAKGYVSPAFAERTGFTQADLDLFFQALASMFEHDRSAARGEMVVRGIYDFEHIGTHADSTDKKQQAQNLRETRLGCAHAHTLFEGIQTALKPGREFPSHLLITRSKTSGQEQGLNPARNGAIFRQASGFIFATNDVWMARSCLTALPPPAR